VVFYRNGWKNKAKSFFVEWRMALKGIPPSGVRFLKYGFMGEVYCNLFELSRKNALSLCRHFNLKVAWVPGILPGPTLPSMVGLGSGARIASGRYPGRLEIRL
jgi:hypothetical protein